MRPGRVDEDHPLLKTRPTRFQRDRLRLVLPGGDLAPQKPVYGQDTSVIGRRAGYGERGHKPEPTCDREVVAKRIVIVHREPVPAAGRLTRLQDRRIAEPPTESPHRLPGGPLGDGRDARGRESRRAAHVGLLELVLEGPSGLDGVEAERNSLSGRRHPIHNGVVEPGQTIGGVSSYRRQSPLRSVSDGIDGRAELSQDGLDRRHRRGFVVNEPHDVAPAPSSTDDLQSVPRPMPIDDHRPRPTLGYSGSDLHSRDTVAGHKLAGRRVWLRPVEGAR